MENPIPEQMVLEICELIKQRNSKRKLNFAKGLCWDFISFSTKKNDIKARCLFNSEAKDNRGCQLINKFFDSEYSKK